MSEQLSENPKPQPHELWQQAGGGTDDYSPAKYRELLVQHGHLVKRDTPPPSEQIAGKHPFQLWKEAGGDPRKYLDLVNADRVRVRLKRGVKLDGEVARELYLHAELSYLETVYERGNWHVAVDHRRGAISTGVICDRSSRTIFPPCAFCHEPESGERICDHPTGNPCKKCEGKKVLEDTWHFMPSLVQVFPCDDCNATGIRTCSKPVCLKCVTVESGLNLCPNHNGRPRPKQPPRAAKVKLEPCEWTRAPSGILNRKCLREVCTTVVSADDRVLYFGRRKRAMCEECGEKYLEVAR